MAEAFVNWFLEAPIENLLRLVGTGGIIAAAVYWWTLWRGRRKIRVRFCRENYELKPEPDCEVELEFEATNLGDKPAALEPPVLFACLTPEGTPLKVTLQVQEEDRILAPNSPRRFSAKAVITARYVFCWYKRYRFMLSRGTAGVLRHRNAQRVPIGFWTFWLEYVLFRFLRIVRNHA